MLNELLRRLLFLPEQRSTVAYDVDVLHYVVIATTMLGATFVALYAGYFIVRYRRRSGDLRDGFPQATARPPLAVELAAVASLFALFLAWWFVGARLYTRIRVAPPDARRVYVTGKQWMWKFVYPEGASTIAQLYVPARRPVELVMSSRDVIHSFYVPDFRVKYDVLPGRSTTLWFEATAPGTYPILCAEYCGTDHSAMRGEVIALDPGDFDRWLADQGPKPEVYAPTYTPPAIPGESTPREPLGLVRAGENVAAEAGCLRCHTADGTPHIGPTWAGMYGAKVPLQGGGSVIADEAYMTESIMDPLARIHEGFAPVMPSYAGRLEPAEVAAILEYIKWLRDTPPSGAATPPVFTPRGPAQQAPPSAAPPVGPFDGNQGSPDPQPAEAPKP